MKTYPENIVQLFARTSISNEILEYYGLQNPNKLNQDDINKSDNKN